jgi:ribosomal RNA-processing protein 8
MRQRLQGGRFRWLNETLYTSDGSEALRMVQGQPDLMDQYHEGEQGWWAAWSVEFLPKVWCGRLCWRQLI